MLNFLDVYERALKGPLMSEQDFDIKVFIPEVRRVVKDYGIKYDLQNPVPASDEEADNLFKACGQIFETGWRVLSGYQPRYPI